MPKNNKTLLLNSDNTPLRVISYKQSIIQCMLEKYFCVETYNETIKSAGGLELKIPAVVISKTYCKRKKVSCKANLLFKRDNYTCGYCTKQFSPDKLTKDHIIPREKGGGNTWTNLVSSCRSCNSRKSNKIWTPKIPVYEPKNELELWKTKPKEWDKYV